MLALGVAAALAGAAAPAEAQTRPQAARLVYTSPSTIARSTPIYLYLIVYDLGKNAAAGSQVRVVRGPNAKTALVAVIRANQVVCVAVHSPTQPFASLDPSVVGKMTAQLGGGKPAAVTFTAYDKKSVVGFFNGNVTAMTVPGQ